MRIKLAAVVAVAYLAIPTWLVVTLWTTMPGWDANWWALWATSEAVAAFYFAVANWNWVGYPLRWIFPLAVTAAAAASGGWGGLALSLGVFAVLGALPWPPPVLLEPVELAFPLRGGRFHVGQGGNAHLINRHYRNAGQCHALDISQLNRWGGRAHGLYPTRLEHYHVLGATVVSPCDGVVTAVERERREQAVATMDRRHPAGNFVMVRIGESEDFVLLAHLQGESVTVEAGQPVHAGQALGRVGNSGNSTEPHLHIHVKRGGAPDSPLDGEGVPMRFGKRLLRRNDVVKA